MASKATTLQAHHSTTQHKQHHRNRLQPKQTTRTHNHSSTRHEQRAKHSTQSTYTHLHINYTKQTSHTPLSNTSQTTSKAAMHTPHSQTKHKHNANSKNHVPQGGLLSPTLFNIYTSDTPTPQAPVKLTTYAHNITITSTHNDINIAKANIQSYLHEIHTP